MIEFVHFKAAYRGFQKDETVIFWKGVNVLVGEQGSGKSTVIHAIAEKAKMAKSFWRRDVNIGKFTYSSASEQKRIYGHDFLHDNPQTAPSFDTMGQLPGDMALSHLWKSHGESTREIWDILLDAQDSYILLDEPDSGLSPSNALRLADKLKKAAGNNNQIIVSIHNPWVIEAFDRVISMDTGRLTKASDHLALQRDTNRAPRDPKKARFPSIAINFNEPVPPPGEDEFGPLPGEEPTRKTRAMGFVPPKK